MNHSPVVIEEDLDDQIKKLYNKIKTLEKQKPEKDLSEVWRYFRKDDTKFIRRARFNIFFEGSYHAIGKMTKAQFKKKLLNHFDVTSDTQNILGLELLDAYIYKPPADGKYRRWKYKNGIFVHDKDVMDACLDGHLHVYSDETQVMTKVDD